MYFTLYDNIYWWKGLQKVNIDLPPSLDENVYVCLSSLHIENTVLESSEAFKEHNEVWTMWSLDTCIYIHEWTICCHLKEDFLRRQGQAHWQAAKCDTTAPWRGNNRQKKRHLSYVPSHMTSVAPYQHVCEHEKTKDLPIHSLVFFAASTRVRSDCGWGREPNLPWKRGRARAWDSLMALVHKAASKTTANWACLVRHHLPIISSLLGAAGDSGCWQVRRGVWEVTLQASQPASLPLARTDAWPLYDSMTHQPHPRLRLFHLPPIFVFSVSLSLSYTHTHTHTHILLSKPHIQTLPMLVKAERKRWR